jgi:hypothetical protein
MTGNEYLKLQIGMFVTDREAKEVKDFCTIQQFDRMGRMKLQPLDNDGRPDGEAYWIHYKDYALEDKMLRSEFNEIFCS